MKRDELREFILQNFDFVQAEWLEEPKVEVFKVDLEKLAAAAKVKLAGEDLGDFARETCEKQVAKFEQTEESNPIFAILHEAEFPVSFEVKTGVALARILREKESVVPSKLMSEREWSKVIGFGQVASDEAKDLVRLSYRLVTE